MKTQTTKNMTAQFTTNVVTKTLLVVVIACFGAVALGHAQEQVQTRSKTHYNVSNLPGLGGTSNGGNSINDQTWVAGYARLPNRNRHAALWRNSSLTDLFTLGGPNSSVTWNVKNTAGIIVGISQTADPEPLGESWSSAAFYSSPNNVGYINLGFVWQNNQMRGLPPFPGGNNGFATGANNLGQVVGWAENGVHDPNCCCTQVLQFLPAVWTLGPPDQIQNLPLIQGDSSGAATAINDHGQIVGISGICDQAVGRHTAKHAVLWQNGTVTDIYPNPPAPWWNTPTAINQRGDVVGFAGDPAFVEGDIVHAFMWTREDGIRNLKPLPHRTPQHVDSEAYGINEARQVVGVSCDADQTDCRAVIWDHGNTPTDLNDLKGSYSAFLALAKDINNKGEITGRAVDPITGVLTAYLAVPVGGQ
jgi:probable HAF family extracellular repeat protein